MTIPANQNSTLFTEAPVPSANIAVNPATILEGGSSTLSWNTGNALEASVGGIGNVALSGSRTVSPAATTDYVLTAKNTAKTKTASARLTVTPAVAVGGVCRIGAVSVNNHNWKYGGGILVAGQNCHLEGFANSLLRWKIVSYDEDGNEYSTWQQDSIGPDYQNWFRVAFESGWTPNARIPDNAIIRVDMRWDFRGDEYGVNAGNLTWPGYKVGCSATLTLPEQEIPWVSRGSNGSDYAKAWPPNGMAYGVENLENATGAGFPEPGARYSYSGEGYNCGAFACKRSNGQISIKYLHADVYAGGAGESFVVFDLTRIG